MVLLRLFFSHQTRLKLEGSRLIPFLRTHPTRFARFSFSGWFRCLNPNGHRNTRASVKIGKSTTSPNVVWVMQQWQSLAVPPEWKLNLYPTAPVCLRDWLAGREGCETFKSLRPRLAGRINTYGQISEGSCVTDAGNFAFFPQSDSPSVGYGKLRA